MKFTVNPTQLWESHVNIIMDSVVIVAAIVLFFRNWEVVLLPLGKKGEKIKLRHIGFTIYQVKYSIIMLCLYWLK